MACAKHLHKWGLFVNDVRINPLLGKFFEIENLKNFTNSFKYLKKSQT